MPLPVRFLRFLRVWRLASCKLLTDARSFPLVSVRFLAGFAKAGVNARGFAVDLSNPEAVKATVQTIRSSFGSIAVIFWNPYGGKAGATEATPADWTAAFNLTTISLSVAVNESLQDLEANKGAVLVTGGALGVVENDFIFQLAVNWVRDFTLTLHFTLAHQLKLETEPKLSSSSSMPQRWPCLWLRSTSTSVSCITKLSPVTSLLARSPSWEPSRAPDSTTAPPPSRSARSLRRSKSSSRRGAPPIPPLLPKR
jgi:hypothetical protein